MGVDDQGEHLPQGEQEVDVLRLVGSGRGVGEHRAQGFGLIEEEAYVGEFAAFECLPVVVEPNLGEPAGAALVEEEVVVATVVLGVDLGEFLRVEEEVRHELHDQRDVHVDRALELG